MDKVETIGDAYMVASGLPTVYERHAQEMSLLALELLESVKHHVIPHLPEQNIQLRIGLHSGSRTFILYSLRIIQRIVGSHMLGAPIPLNVAFECLTFKGVFRGPGIALMATNNVYYRWQYCLMAILS